MVACSENGADATDVTWDGRAPHILGGTPDVEHGFVGALTLAPSGAVVCSAALISPYHVLTAAHCLTDRKLTSLRFFVGDAATESGGRYIRISSAHPHPDFDTLFFAFDAAVLRLAEPVHDVPVAALSLTPEIDLHGAGTVLFSGFGQREDGSSGARYQALVSVASQSATMFSTQYTEALRTGLCFADSGAPALRTHPEEPEVIGIISGVLAWSHAVDPCHGTYNITRLLPVLPFVAEVLGQDTAALNCRDIPALCPCSAACHADGRCVVARCEVHNCMDAFQCLSSCPAFDGACFNDCYISTRACSRADLHQFITCGAAHCAQTAERNVLACLEQHCADALANCMTSRGCADDDAEPQDTTSPVDTDSAALQDGPGNSVSDTASSPEDVSPNTDTAPGHGMTPEQETASTTMVLGGCATPQGQMPPNTRPSLLSLWF